MKKLIIGSFVLLGILISMSFATPQETESEKVNWRTLEEASKLTKANPKKVLVDVYTDWCGWCKRMDKDTFQHPQIAKYINDHFYAVKLDGEGKAPLTIDGSVLSYHKPEGRRGYHEAAAMLLKGKMSYPTIAFLSEKFQSLILLPGYQDPIDLDKVMRYIEEGHMEEGISYQLFQRTYKSRIKMPNPGQGTGK